MKMNVKKGDNVLVLTGKEKGSTGKVVFVNPKSEFVKVENTNMISRHKKARSAQDTGGIMKQEGNIHVSNVQIICPDCKKATRVGHKDQGDKKVRMCLKCGASLDVKAEKEKATKKAKKEAKAKKPAEPKSEN